MRCRVVGAVYVPDPSRVRSCLWRAQVVTLPLVPGSMSRRDMVVPSVRRCDGAAVRTRLAGVQFPQCLSVRAGGEPSAVRCTSGSVR